MASAATKISVTCPHCAKALRLSTRPAEGKKIKCPSCESAFVPDLDDDDPEMTAVQENPKVKAKSKGNPDARPRGKKSYEDDDEPAPSTKRRRDDEDDEVDEDDDRPSPRKKKAKSGGGMMMVLLLLFLGGGLVLSLGCLGIGAFVWPGFLRGEEKKLAENPPPPAPAPVMPDGNPNPNPPPPQPKQDPPAAFAGGDNPKNFILPEANMVMGFEVKKLRDLNQLQPWGTELDMLMRREPAFKDFFETCDSMWFSMVVPDNAGQLGGAGLKFKTVWVVQGATPDFANKIKVRPDLGQERRLAGKYAVYQPQQLGPNSPTYYLFSSDRTIVFTTLDENEFVALLDRAMRNPGAPVDLAKLCAPVENSHVWGAMKFNDEMRAGFQTMADNKDDPRIASAGQTMMRAKGGSLSVDSINNGAAIRFRVNVECGNGQDASSLRQATEGLKETAMFFLNNAMGGPGGGGAPPAIMRDLNTIAFRSQGSLATASVDISLQTIKDLAKGFEKKGFPDFGNPPKDFAKGDRPKFDGPGKDLPNLDFPNKDFPNKDFPKNDGFNKGGPPGKPQSYAITKLFAGKLDERRFFLQAGRRVTISVNSVTSLATTNVDVFVLRGETGTVAVASDTKRGPNATVTFTVPVTGTYRVRVVNRGPGIANSCLVNIREQ